MTYEEALEFIHGIQRFGSKPGIERIKKLLERMGNPQNKLHFIHVAGTNGKGSTCAMLSHIMCEAGYKTGLYISPFVLDFRERMQVNNEMISRGELADITAYVKAFWQELADEGDPPTEFTVVCAIAMEYFYRSGCDVVVLEVGMGGRFDATNIIAAPLVSVITNISLDHTAYLGETIGKIAFEKCGIIKHGGITVSYPKQDPEALAVIMERCAEEENRLLIPNSVEVIRQDIDGSDVKIGDLELHIPFMGEHQVYNAMTAVETCRALEFTSMQVTDDDIIKGIAATKFPSRMEILRRSPLVIIDGAHNPAKMAALGKSLGLFGGRRIHGIVGMSGDKDIDGSLAGVLPKLASATVTATSDNPRAMAPSGLFEVAKRYCGDVYLAENPKEAFSKTLDRCKEDDVILICGSLFLTSELRPIVLYEQ